MTIQPDFDTFRDAYEQGKPQVVWTTLVADLETPVSAMLKLTDGEPYRFLFESVEGGATRARYSIIGLKPDIIWRARGNQAEINRIARADRHKFRPCPGDTLSSLRALIAESRIDLPHELPPMASGLYGYFGYEMVRLVETKVPSANPDNLGIPDALFIRPSIMAIFDSVKDVVTVVSPAWVESGVDARAAYNRAAERIADTVADFERDLPVTRSDAGVQHKITQPQSNMSRGDYHAMVAKAKEYIAAGDIFQVVPSQRFRLPFALPPIALYRSLRRLNPSPFMFYLDLDGFSIVGSSPEILVRLRDGRVTIRPIAGTRPRGITEDQDIALEKDLLNDPKELAEHLMLLDLGRNDVGRVAKVGTVKVTQRNVIERYSHVMHIVSNVEGEIDPRHDAVDALLAGFPAGTVSGAPKVRAMEIIDELEPEKRNLYAGGVGYFSANGSMDTCIALRTAVVKDGTLVVQAGGGVVLDSDPEAEYQESCNKARAVIRAAEEAIRFASRDRQ
ncbi:anthranilate synthase component I [Zavarzinia aquatilis]|uniref:Anthranilate synthase component 1 n=1 Tax=Zavarzinia aquatilis TaxID=2211142 RepID=A0A317EHN4_9PROT|nr:anthranilate synthase component I [Zavarzinia aquatilis]PWR25844.1 anthranilate synthase component I [Zavarzinia aquatilis]